MRSREWNRILASLALTAPMAIQASAETYLTENQAAAVLFPGVRLEPRWIDLSADDIKKISRASGERVSEPHVRFLMGPHQEIVMIDRVIGKHELITYAVGLEPQGQVRGVEIMDYRETYGYQIRNKAWREQFMGKTARDPIQLEKDIKNISGATLSSAHVTNGVRRILQTYEILKSRI